MTKKIVIFGNAGSGKSTLAKACSSKYGLFHLDLDVLAWLKQSPPERRPLDESIAEINLILSENPNWVVEGGYSDLLSVAVERADKLFFLNPGVKVCVENCRNRPWEPHKYPSLKAQNENLDMLIDWVQRYTERSDTFSLRAHEYLFNTFTGDKTQVTSNRPIL